MSTALSTVRGVLIGLSDVGRYVAQARNGRGCTKNRISLYSIHQLLGFTRQYLANGGTRSVKWVENLGQQVTASGPMMADRRTIEMERLQIYKAGFTEVSDTESPIESLMLVW